jgi:hypothetical protein
MVVVPQRKKNQKEGKVLKLCQYPGCETSFRGTGQSKFCHHHRDKKYKSILYSKKRKQKKLEDHLNNPNQTIQHTYSESQQLEFVCALDGCNEKFEVTVLPRTFTYPRYCSKHRNENCLLVK